MPQIKLYNGTIKEFVDLSRKQNAPFKLIDPLPEALEQHGHTCKLVSLSVVMNWRYLKSASTIAIPPPPVQKRERKNYHAASLRFEAKHKYGSDIGEIYHPDILLNLANDHEYTNSRAIETDDDNYLKHLLEEISAGNPAIVFFDVDSNNGHPINSASQNEHSAVIVGWFIDFADDVWLIAIQWGAYYKIKAQELKNSANQLTAIRKPENFYKFEKDWRQREDRRDRDAGLRSRIAEREYSKMVTTKPETKAGSGFKNKILIVNYPAPQPKKILQNSITPNSLVIEQKSLAILPSFDKKFIPLDELINFIEIDTIRHDNYTNEKLKEFADFFDFDKEIKKLTTETYNSQIDETLDDDIYRQNPKRSRSITELVSNAIDAKPESIHVTLKDGEYEVRDVRGKGINPVIIFRKLILTKSTSKEDLSDNIGRFGLGFYTALAHLDSPHDYVLVETKDADFPGYSIEYRKIHGKMHINISRMPTLLEPGTRVVVHAEKITLEEFRTALIENVEHHVKTPIILNGELINIISKENYHDISDSTVMLKPDSPEKKGIISIGGITIKTYQVALALNTMQVVWDLPKYVTLSESRNQIRVDSTQVRNEIRQLINFGLQVPKHLQIRYFNTIAPIVENLQEYNTSTHSDDDVLAHLQTVTASIFKDVPQAPDLEHLVTLNTPGTIALHPALLQITWKEKIAYQPDEFKSFQETISVYIIPMVIADQEIGFIHDDEEKIVYIAKASYEKIVAANELWKLTSIFKHPQNELPGEWSSFYGSILRFRDDELVREKQTVAIEYKFTAGMHHELYQKHGVLHELGDDFLASLPTTSYQAIKDAPVLINSYPIQPIHTHHGDFKLYLFEELTRYQYAGQIYYLAKVTNHGLHLLNNNFQPLFQFKDKILFEKIKQLHEANKKDCEVTLSENDRLIIDTPGTLEFAIYDGTGKRCIDEDFTGHGFIEILSDKYFSVHASKYFYIYHFQKGLLYKVENEHANVKVFCLDPLILIITKSYQPIQLFHIEKNEALPTDNSKVVLCERFYICYKKSTTGGSQVVFTIYNLEGKPLFTYSELYNLYKISVVHFQLLNSFYYISLIRENKTQELLICPDNLTSFSSECRRFDNKQVIGFPVRGYIKEQADGKSYYISINNRHSPIEIKSVTSYQNATRSSEMYGSDFYECYSRERTVTEWLQKRIFLLAGIKQKMIIDDLGNIVIIPKACQTYKFETINSYSDYYLLVSEKNSFFSTPKKVLIDAQGKIIVMGDEIEVLKTLDHVYYATDNKQIINSDGKVILDSKFDHVIPYHRLLKIAYAVSSDEIEYDLINNEGESILGRRYKYASSQHQGYYELSTDNSRAIMTAHAFIPSAYIDKYTALITCQNLMYSAHGYPLFQIALDEPKLYGFDVIGDARFRLYVPLTASQLQSPRFIQNISYLNTLKLNSVLYANTLRFSDAEPVDFQEIFPYMRYLIYTPTTGQTQQYAGFYKKIENYSSADKLALTQLLDLVYSIAGTYSTINMAEKIYQLLEIYGIRPLNRFLDGLRTKTNILKCTIKGVENERALINDMPQELAQFIYFIFSPDTHLLSLQKEIVLPLTPNKPKPLSLLDLFTAHRLDKNITRYVKDKPLFYAAIAGRIQGCRQHHLQRKINHAIYHQAHPEKFLYLREFIQNAIDAYADTDSDYVREIPLHIFKNDKSACVLSLNDKGKGMTVEEVFGVLLIPGNSSKRNADKGKFIGGRGVGLFTAFHNAHCIQLKTSIGDGETHYFILTPVYETLPNNEQRVVDILIDWETVQEQYQGLKIERVSLPKTNPNLEAAKYQRAVSTHARFIDGNLFDVTINGVSVNKPMPTLMEFTIPGFGNVKFYKSKENAITGGGLFIKDIPANFFDQLPAFIKKLLTSKGLVIDLPKSVALNRERNDFESTEQFTTYLTPYIYRNCYAVYINLFSMGLAELPELPYDFFSRFKVNLDDLIARNPDVIIDADILNIGGVLEDYSRYSSPQLLTDLLCFLSLIPLKIINNHTQKMSLVAIAKLFHSKIFSEEIEKQLPEQIREQIKDHNDSKTSVANFNGILQPAEQFKNIAWIPKHYNSAPEWRLFMELSEYVIRALTDKPIRVGFSTLSGYAIASTLQGSDFIYWNPVNVRGDGDFAHAFFNHLAVPSLTIFQKALEEIIDTISHELVHLSDAPCTGTHNRSFEIKQRNIQLKGLLKIEAHVEYEKFTAYYTQHMLFRDTLPILDFLESQLGDFVKSNSAMMISTPSNFFTQDSIQQKRLKTDEGTALSFRR